MYGPRHHGHWRHWRNANPLVRYVRSRMHRRIFLWFGASILATFGVAAAMMFSGWNRTEWQQRMHGSQHLLGSQFERVWDDPVQRAALASTVSRDLAVDVGLHDLKTGALAQFGEPCPRGDLRAQVLRGDEKLGTVELCFARQWPSHPLHVLGAFGLATLILWGASGRIARRLTRPLGELTRVTREIGEGNLTARARLNPMVHGEAGILGHAINDMAQRIQRQMSDQRELLAAVSHELRTPLARIRILTELGRTGGAQPKILDDLDREVVEIDALVGDLLASSRMDFSALALTQQDAVGLAVRALERAGLPASLLVNEAQGAWVEADATLLSRALANLLDNSQRHGKGALRLRVSTSDDAVSFEVQDAGPGFAPGEEAQAFDGFLHRRRDPQTDAGGLGLGLSLVKRIAEAHGGKAYARNLPQRGAVVGFSLPAKRGSPARG